MNIFLSRLHTRLRSALVTLEGATEATQDAQTGIHKSYARMPRIALPAPETLPITLQEALAQRSSYSQAGSVSAFSPEVLGTLLGSSLQKRSDDYRRAYPSGGALFPIETYLIGLTTENRAPGAYHYNPTEHALEHLWDIDSTFTTRDLTTTKNVPTGSALVVFTAVWDRSSRKYGNLTYLHAAIEAGHMAQNILLVATALNILARPLAGFDDAKIEQILDLDTRIEQPIYSVLVSTRATPTA